MANGNLPRRVGQVISRGKDKWLIRIFRGKDSNGKRSFHNETVTGNKNHAEKILRARIHEMENGLLSKPTKDTLDSLLDRWLDVIRPKLSKRTHEDYTELMERYVRSRLGSKELSSISSDDIQNLYTEMSEKKKLSGRTVRYVHTVLNAALKSAIKTGCLRINPAEDTQRPKKNQKEMIALTPEEARKFLDAIKGDRYETVFILALDSGMRPEEYLGLKWGDVDLDKRTITVKRTLCWTRKGRKNDGGGWYIGEPKSSKSRRTIHISTATVNSLLSHRPKDFSTEDFVFVTTEGGPIISDNLSQRHFKPALKKAKLPNIRLYDLRHTMATALLVAGVNPKIVSERLGHSSVVLTLDTYSHIIPGLQEIAREKLETLIFNCGQVVTLLVTLIYPLLL